MDLTHKHELKNKNKRHQRIKKQKYKTALNEKTSNQN